MGILNIRVWAGGLLANPQPPKNLFVMTADTSLAGEMDCAAAVRGALADDHGTSAQAALRFVLGNRDLASRVLGITRIDQLDEAIEAIARGPLPSTAVAKLNVLWATGFRPG
jgi:aryl-alcohol dehydrogenase-like predicted oxidoreductase